ncbi:MAG: flagellar motor switch phosphatase FliY [Clostridia bacterium]|nr:flagellar motor switch phosphatase FliY [Clostridia bacterium]
MSDLLTQEEIDALLNGNNSEKEPPLLTNEEIDALGEIGNISMGTSATTLSTLLGKKVTITTPRVEITSLRKLIEEYPIPFIAVRVKYTKGLEGINLLIIKEEDVKIITDLMMGGDGTNIDEEINDFHLSAIAEAMNQMIGSAATSLSSMLKKDINISPPNAFEFKFDADLRKYFTDDQKIIKTAFNMKVDTLIDSEIMQLLDLDFGREMSRGLLIAEDEEKEEQVQDQLEETEKPDMQDKKDDGTDKATKKVVNVSPVELQEFDNENAVNQTNKIELLYDIPLNVTVQLGKTQKTIKEILQMSPGSVVELDRLAGEPVDVLINGKIVAKGEVVVIDENFGVRLIDIINRKNRIKL